jgi:hypothetical protein
VISSGTKGKDLSGYAADGEKDLDLYAVAGQYGSGKTNGITVSAYREEKGWTSASNTTFFPANFISPTGAGPGVLAFEPERGCRRVTEVVIQFYQRP